MATSGYKWFYVAKSGVVWFSVVQLFSVVQWFYVAKSDEKWIKVVISCG